uniref:OB domain-containing protein n=1 Tax=Capitella teleta TaxID=283909 RepID=X2A9P4_CAPTE
MASENGTLSIKDLKPNQKNVNLVFIVLEIGKPNHTQRGMDVRSVKVADKTGSINISLWGDLGVEVQTGDICRLSRGYTNMWKGCLTLYTSKTGEIIKIGEFCMVFSETPNMSEPNPESIKQLEDSGQNPLGNNGNGHQRRSPTDGPVGLEPGTSPASMSSNSGMRPGMPPMQGHMSQMHMPGHMQGGAMPRMPDMPTDPRTGRSAMRPHPYNNGMPPGGMGGRGRGGRR